MYIIPSHAILPAPSPYFSFKAVSQTSFFLHWYLFSPIVEFDVWRRAIFSKH